MDLEEYTLPSNTQSDESLQILNFPNLVTPSSSKLPSPLSLEADSLKSIEFFPLSSHSASDSLSFDLSIGTDQKLINNFTGRVRPTRPSRQKDSIDSPSSTLGYNPLPPSLINVPASLVSPDVLKHSVTHVNSSSTGSSVHGSRTIGPVKSWRGVSVGSTVSKLGIWTENPSNSLPIMTTIDGFYKTITPKESSSKTSSQSQNDAGSSAHSDKPEKKDYIDDVDIQISMWNHVINPYFGFLDVRVLNLLRYYLERGASETVADATFIDEGENLGLLDEDQLLLEIVSPGESMKTTKIIDRIAELFHVFKDEKALSKLSKQHISMLVQRWKQLVATIYSGFEDVPKSVLDVPVLPQRTMDPKFEEEVGRVDGSSPTATDRPSSANTVRFQVNTPNKSADVRIKIPESFGSDSSLPLSSFTSSQTFGDVRHSVVSQILATSSVLAPPSRNQSHTQVVEWTSLGEDSKEHKVVIAPTTRVRGAEAFPDESKPLHLRKGYYINLKSDVEETSLAIAFSQSELIKARSATAARVSELLARVIASGEASKDSLAMLGLDIDPKLQAAYFSPAIESSASFRQRGSLTEVSHIVTSPSYILDDGHEILPHNYPKPPQSCGHGSLDYNSTQPRTSHPLAGCNVHIHPEHDHGSLRVRRSERNEALESLLEDSYTRIVIWRYVSECLERGFADHEADYAKHKDDDSVPASWKVPVDGRPSASDPASSEPQVVETVCSVCCDGKTSFENPLVYCDGCDLGVHRYCYGISDIPEGDYYCDSCSYVKEVRRTNSKAAIKDLVCCLCPITGGALKLTSDGRWAHVSCALWLPGCWIANLRTMSPIVVNPITSSFLRSQHLSNLSELELLLEKKQGHEQLVEKFSTLQPHLGRFFEKQASPTSAASRWTSASSRPLDVSRDQLDPKAPADPSSGDSVPPCSICHLSMGRVIRCCSGREGVSDFGSANPCHAFFHPLCAYFDGLFARVSVPRVNESSPPCNFYAGGGKGISFSFFCEEHTPADVFSRLRDEQRNIRLKYRNKERQDLLDSSLQRKASATARPRNKSAQVRLAELNAQIEARRAAAHASFLRTGTLTNPLSGSILLSPPPIVQVTNVKPDAYDVSLCSVCFEPTSKNFVLQDPEFLVCTLCGIAVHFRCHGAVTMARNPVQASTYSCARCLTLANISTRGPVGDANTNSIARSLGLALMHNTITNVSRYDTQCAICLRFGGFMKQSRTKDYWTHLFCALILPGVCFATLDSLEGVDIQKVHPSRRRNTCAICANEAGYTVSCEKCKLPFHPMCAVLEHCYFNWKVVDNRVMGFVYCHAHSPPDQYYNPTLKRWMHSLMAKNLPLLPSNIPKSYSELSKLRLELVELEKLMLKVKKREKLKMLLVDAEERIFHSARRLLGDSNPCPSFDSMDLDPALITKRSEATQFFQNNLKSNVKSISKVLAPNPPPVLRVDQPSSLRWLLVPPIRSKNDPIVALELTDTVDLVSSPPAGELDVDKASSESSSITNFRVHFSSVPRDVIDQLRQRRNLPPLEPPKSES
jgi:PHD-zinc-finger like domain/PHD-finger